MANSRKKKQQKGKGLWQKLRIASGALLLILIFIAGYIFFEEMTLNNRELTPEEYFQVSGEKVALLYNYELQSATALKEGEKVYIPLVWFSTLVDDKFYYNDDEKQLIITTANEVITVGYNERNEEGLDIFKQRNNNYYMLLDFAIRYSDIRIDDYTNLEVKRLNVFNDWGNYLTTETKGVSRVFLEPAGSADVVIKLKKGTPVCVVEELDQSEYAMKSKKWIKVTTGEGFTGYMRKSRLNSPSLATEESRTGFAPYTSIHREEKIVLGWHQVTVADANAGLEDMVANTDGMNVISPTWFALSDNEGNYTSLADEAYVNKAHELGLEVWPLIDNFSEDVSLNTLLSGYVNRQKLISKLMEDARVYGFDGINIDFESLKSEAAIHYVQFIRELSVSCRKSGLVLSVDFPNYESFNAYYNRKDIGEVVDYVINMGYDEHYSGSEKGSVASIGFVKRGIENTLKEVEAQKVINAVPFYTRVWTTAGNKTTSSALGIAAAKNWIDENGIEMTWDEEIGQLFGEKASSVETKSIWMEEERSLQLKMDYMKEKDLAGVAVWKLGLEPKEIWDVIKAINP